MKSIVRKGAGKEGAWSVRGLPCAFPNSAARGGVDNREVPVHSILIEDARTFFSSPDLDPHSRPPSTERHETAASSKKHGPLTAVDAAA